MKSVFFQRRMPLVTDESFMIDWFYGLNVISYRELEKSRTAYHNRIPPELLAFGYSPGGDNFCIAIAGKNLGKIYYWDHDYEVEEDEIPGYQNITLLCDSFTEFIDSLVEAE